MKLVPLYNKVIVEIIPEEGDDITESGIILTSSPKPFYRGKVTGVGCGHYQNAKRIATLEVQNGASV